MPLSVVCLARVKLSNAIANTSSHFFALPHSGLDLASRPRHSSFDFSCSFCRLVPRNYAPLVDLATVAGHESFQLRGILAVAPHGDRDLVHCGLDGLQGCLKSLLLLTSQRECQLAGLGLSLDVLQCPFVDLVHYLELALDLLHHTSNLDLLRLVSDFRS